jgi:4a-hydroxytetrahydrobiopterin dehydratase
VHDDVPTFDLAFVVVDARTRRPIDFFQAVYGGEHGGGSMRTEIASGEVVLNDVPEGSDITWTVAAPGYAPARGHSEVIVGSGPLREAEIELYPGWGTRVRVRAREKGQSTEGARILFDGIEVGVLDVNGELDVRLPSRPESVAVELDGWQVVPGNDVNEAGRFRSALVGRAQHRADAETVATRAIVARVRELPGTCSACRADAPRIEPGEAAELRARHVPKWTLDYPKLTRSFRLRDFRKSLAWINRVGMLAEEERHHPDFHLTGWNRVELVLWTHAIDGLSENDFVLAAKIDELAARDGLE